MLKNRTISGAYQFLIFFASFLLFAIEPIIAKYIVPWFGGSPSVWITALLFFQVLLLVGYAYARFIARLRLKYQVLGYLGTMLITLATLSITPDTPQQNLLPAAAILLLLTMSVGLPYCILSATSPLLQWWSSVQDPTAKSYRLYAWSNIGSLLGLLSYPVLIEPFLSVQQQVKLWSFLFVLLSLCLGALCWTLYYLPARPADAAVPSEPVVRPRPSDKVWWLLLSFAASVMLLAVTNYLTQDIASVPLLWILPLSIYLLSFIVTFQNEKFYDRNFLAPLFLYGSLIGGFIITLGGNISNAVLLITTLLLLGIFSLVCNGKLYALRPNTRYLTSFYLWISGGGALGGIFVALIAPSIFPMYFEFHFGLCFTLICIIVLWRRRKLWVPTSHLKIAGTRAMFSIAITVVCISVLNIYQALRTPIYVHRDFFGSVRIEESNDHRSLYHGKTLHGMQFTRDDLKCWPTTYYGYTSGLGRAISVLDKTTPIHIGVVGLGAGTAAVYGDSIKFYELNPEMKSIALNRFSYLSACAKQYDIVLGDARLSLEREEPQQFQVLALDAFSSDSIPVHLLTAEAFRAYLKHLAPHGIIAIHISNRYLDFKPIIGGLAKEFNLIAAVIDDPGESKKGVAASMWAVLSDDPAFFTELQKVWITEHDAMTFDRRILWTDTKSNILSIFKLY